MSLSNIVEIIAGGPGESVRPVLGDEANPGQRVQLLELTNHFEDNMEVSGLVVGEDLQRCLGLEPEGYRYLLPDNYLNDGRPVNGLRPELLSRHDEILTVGDFALLSAFEPPKQSKQINGELVR